MGGMKRKAEASWTGPIKPIRTTAAVKSAIKAAPAKSAIRTPPAIPAGSVGAAWLTKAASSRSTYGQKKAPYGTAAIAAGPAKSGLRAPIKPAFSSQSSRPSLVGKSLFAKKAKFVVEEDEGAEEAEEQEEVAEEEEEELVDETRYMGQVAPAKGAGKFTVVSEDISAMHGSDAKITWKSGAPRSLSVGDWISFCVREDMGVLLAWSIDIADAPEECFEGEEVVEEEEDEDIGGEEVEEEEALEEDEAEEENYEGEAEEDEVEVEEEEAELEEEEGEADESEELVIHKSSAVAMFRKAQATGTGFSAGWKTPNSNRTIGRLGGAPLRQVAKAKAKAGRKLPPFKKAFIAPPEKLSKAEQKQLTDMRSEMLIDVEGQGTGFPPILSFQELDGVLPDYVSEALDGMGIEAPMPVQAQALPLILSGKDVVGIARTGSGKTLAYLLPALPHIEAQKPLERGSSTPICLVLAPVRELAVQIAEEAKKLVGSSNSGNHKRGLGAVAIYGGGSGNKGWQVQALREGCHIVAATPGRLVDLLSTHEIGLSRVTYFVLDEADRMLDDGFGDQVAEINKNIRPDRQCLFFSATWPPQVQNLAAEMCSSQADPVRLTVGQHESGIATTREDIVQEVVVFDEPNWEDRDKSKQELLYAHLREVLSDRRHKMLVFLSRKTLCDEMVNRLWAEGFKCQSMHGGKSQDSRLDILDQFKNDKLKLLVTTDVMGRGLDIPDISHVVVYDMGEVEDYVHRIGRTARGPYGKGHALTFFEYDRKWPLLAGQLLEVMEQSGQEAPDDLVRIAQEVENGERGGKGLW